MRQGNILVEQVTKDGGIEIDYDISLAPSEIYEYISNYFPNISHSPEDQRFILGEYKGHKFAIRCKNVTYLGNPHPLYKKRIQIGDELKVFCDYAKSIGATPILLGLYTYCDNTLFVEFGIETYGTKSSHNSSAHIYTDDLAIAAEENYFQKIDFFGNRVTAFTPEAVEAFLDDVLQVESVASCEDIPAPVGALADSIPAENVGQFATDILPYIRDFFAGLDKQWQGIDCYRQMIEDDYRNKYQPEWVGFYYEYAFEKYLEKKGIHDKIRYAQDKKAGGIDLDLYFPGLMQYGDLKAHSLDSPAIAGNDRATIFNIINKPGGRVYYIVLEHSTVKDRDCDYVVTQFWNRAQGKTNLMSYANRMKNSVKLLRAYVLDINADNKCYLNIFRQGINSNGKPRPPKIMIDKESMDHFIVETISF
ncbi:MAG: hypothetical protein K5773_03655 [Pseudobutyrivibrio sp.]|nr:hypothetical protein [Pseudobutyrivibrio sp.]